MNVKTPDGIQHENNKQLPPHDAHSEIQPQSTNFQVSSHNFHAETSKTTQDLVNVNFQASGFDANVPQPVSEKAPDRSPTESHSPHEPLGAPELSQLHQGRSRRDGKFKKLSLEEMGSCPSERHIWAVHVVCAQVREFPEDRSIETAALRVSHDREIRDGVPAETSQMPVPRPKPKAKSLQK